MTAPPELIGRVAYSSSNWGNEGHFKPGFFEEVGHDVAEELTAAGFEIIATERLNSIAMAAAIYLDWSLGEPYALTEDDIAWINARLGKADEQIASRTLDGADLGGSA